MAPPSPPYLMILETSQISPAPAASPAAAASPSAAAAAAAKSLPLTFFDVFWLRSPPVERIFFYEFPAPTPAPPAAAFVSALKSSLSLALRSYFPLAGRLRLSPDDDCRYEIFCSAGDSVAFTSAEWVDAADFDELSAGRPRDAAKLRLLVPDLELSPGEPQALLAVQATVFPGRGAAVGVAVHHAACDGSTSTRFVHTWAAACRRILNPDAASSPPPPPPPLVDRSVIPDPRGLYSIFYNDLPSPDDFKFNAEPPAADDRVLLASFELTRVHIQAIKKRVAERSAQPIKCSTTVAAFAFVWAGHALARRGSAAGGGSQRLHFLFPADFRRRWEPPIPAEYFGNCVGPCFAEADAEELLGGEGLAAAAAAIARGIEALSSGLGGAENWMRRVKAVAAEGGALTAAGSPRFGVYGADFGLGRPRRVEIVSVATTGALALAEAPEGGGVQIGLGLRPPELELLQNYFVQALKDLTE